MFYYFVGSESVENLSGDLISALSISETTLSFIDNPKTVGKERPIDTFIAFAGEQGSKCTGANRNDVPVREIVKNIVPVREIMLNIVPVREIIKICCYSSRKTLFAFRFSFIRKKG